MPTVDLSRVKTSAEIAASRLAEWRAAASVSKNDFAIALAASGTLTEAEATAWDTVGTLPPAAAAAILTLPLEQQRPARMKIAGVTTVHRNSPFVALLAGAYGLTDEQVDALFT